MRKFVTRNSGTNFKTSAPYPRTYPLFRIIRVTTFRITLQVGLGPTWSVMWREWCENLKLFGCESVQSFNESVQIPSNCLRFEISRRHFSWGLWSPATKSRERGGRGLKFIFIGLTWLGACVVNVYKFTIDLMMRSYKLTHVYYETKTC
jgi:hypothetical protein